MTEKKKKSFFAPRHDSVLNFGKCRRFIPLRYRFIFFITCMLSLVLGIIALILGAQYRRTISEQMEGRGIAIAQSLAAASTANLLTYNYVALERSANQAAQAFDILYVIYHDKEGRVAGYSGRADLQNKRLQDEVTEKALQAGHIFIQKCDNASKIESLDIAVPVHPPGTEERWGVVRVGLSLAPVHKQIHQMELVIVSIGLIALICGGLISIWGARRITRPLDNLVAATQEAAKGNLDQNIDIQTRDEVGFLASQFSTMMLKIRGHRHQLEKRFLQIEHLQRYTTQLLTTMRDGLLCVDMHGRIKTLNPAARKMLSGSKHTIAQGDDIDVLLPEFINLYGYIQKIIDTPREHQPQGIRCVTAEGSMTLVVEAGILKDKMDIPLEIILSLHDITPIKKLKYSMRQAQIMNKHQILKLERENLQARFEALKSQLSPHFLFNTFGTLISLIEKDQETAVHYVEQLSQVYRHLLNTRDKELISLSKELEFVASYAFLVKGRFGHNLDITMNVPDDLMNSMIPPLSIQILIENAIKHNIISTKQPLRIDVETTPDNYLIVKNNLQKKRTLETSTKLGLTNLVRRYEFFTDRKLTITSDAMHFVVSLPIIRRLKTEVN